MATTAKLLQAIHSFEEDISVQEGLLRSKNQIYAGRMRDMEELQRKKREVQAEYQRLRLAVKAVDGLLGKIAALEADTDKAVLEGTVEYLVHAAEMESVEAQAETHPAPAKALEEVYAAKCEIEELKRQHEHEMEKATMEQRDLRMMLSKCVDSSGPPTPRLSRDSRSATPGENGIDIDVLTALGETLSAGTSSAGDGSVTPETPRTRRTNALFRIEQLMGIRAERRDVAKQVQDLQKENAILRDRSDHLSEIIQYTLEQVYAGLAPKIHSGGIKDKLVRAIDGQKTKDTRHETLHQERVMIEDALRPRRLRMLGWDRVHPV